MESPVLRALFLLIVIDVGFSAALSEKDVDQGRVLLGRNAVFDEKQLSYFNAPKNSEILIQAGTDCPEPLPVGEQANNGLLCGFVLRARGCLNYTDTEPFWVARDCKGQTCTAENSPWETECILGNYGVHIDTKNRSREATCGLDPSDESWLSPAINPASNTCSVVTPPGVRSDTWAKCVDGRPRLQYKLTFDKKSRSMPKNERYACKVIPMCLHGKPRRFHSTMLCYVEGVGTPAEEERDMEELLEKNVDGTINEGGDDGKRSYGVDGGFGLWRLLVVHAVVCLFWVVW
ncbi:hypothetical protein BSKO_12698 [Bryopsis sp. KO-2023]|nr:hypothetical protein BSKO_12698 [Bryopsis sp. KO-2023]